MDKMIPRKRVELTLGHQEADRVPIDIGSTANNFTNALFFRLKDFLGITSQDILMRPDESAAYYNDDLLEKLGSDFRHVFLMPPDNVNFKVGPDGCTVNDWGLKKRKINGLTEIVNSPLSDADMDDIDKYNWPNPGDPGRVRGLKERAKFLYEHTNYALASRAVSHGFFELAWELRGMENFLVDMAIDKEFANKLLDKTLEIQMGLYEALLKDAGSYLQMVETADDYGTQNGPIMSPAMFREMIKPRRKELNCFIKQLAPNAKIFHHTCGSVYMIIDDLIDTGIDILNPVQPLAKDMDSYMLKKKFGDKLCFHGGIDEQQALPGSKEQLEQEIKQRIDAFSPGGGYIVAPTSNFQDDTPIENILFYLEFVKNYGKYNK
jgi:uroporphyrinogen decarboxylase